MVWFLYKLTATYSQPTATSNVAVLSRLSKKKRNMPGSMKRYWLALAIIP